MDPPFSVPIEVQEIFRQYIASVREMIELTAAALVKGWPDRKPTISTMTRLGHLNRDLELLRFQYLVDHKLLTPEACKSLKSISDRIWSLWDPADEDGLKATSEAYRAIGPRMEALGADFDGSLLTGPLTHANRDPEYLRGVEENGKEYWALDARLKALADARTPP
jgi:hypothetical protein